MDNIYVLLFWYNCINLGLTLGANAAVLSKNELVDASLFTFAINHKQVLPYPKYIKLGEVKLS